MSSPTDLPPNVRRLVDEIENEIGETSVATDDITGSRGRDHAGEASTDNGKVEAAVREILLEIGEDPDRQGLLGTPERVHRMYTELTAGYHVDPDRLINGAIFDVDYSEMVIVKDIPFYSLCEHHLLPFFGTAAVAYIPRGRVIGLSKIPRIVETYARRLQVQERLTQEIAHFLRGSAGAAGRRRRHRGDPPVRGHARRAQARDGHDDLVGAGAVPDPRPDPLRVPRPPRAAGPRRLTVARFTARLEPIEGGTFVVIPAEVVEALQATGRTSVVGTIDGHPLRHQFMPYTFEGVGRQVVMAVNKATREAIGKVAGDTVEFDLERDERSRSADIEIPPELAEALAADPAASAAFDGLAPSRRREHADHVAEAKRPETRLRRAAEVIAGLRR